MRFCKFLLFLCVVCNNTVYAQVQLSPVLIGSMGGDTAIGNVQFTWSIGEMTTETLSKSNITLTQGFNQPEFEPVLELVKENSCRGFSNGLATATVTGAGPFKYSWSTNRAEDTTNQVVNLAIGNYTVIARSLIDSSFVITKRFSVVEIDNCLKIYTGITPNGDNNNDSWYIQNIELYPNEVKVFNRWGSEVWSTVNYNNDKNFWNGNNKANQPLSDGTYFYVIISSTDNASKRKVYKGWVELTGSSN